MKWLLIPLGLAAGGILAYQIGTRLSELAAILMVAVTVSAFVASLISVAVMLFVNSRVARFERYERQAGQLEAAAYNPAPPVMVMQMPAPAPAPPPTYERPLAPVAQRRPLNSSGPREI